MIIISTRSKSLARGLFLLWWTRSFFYGIMVDMKISNSGYTNRQKMYALRTWGGEKKSRREIAKDLGWSNAVADHPKQKIESTKGYKNAMAEIADQSNAVALKVYNELQARDMSKLEYKDLLGSLKVISEAWKIFNMPNEKDQNPLQSKAILLQHIQNQNINTQPQKDIIEIKPE